MEVNRQIVLPQSSYKIKEQPAAKFKIGDVNLLVIKNRLENTTVQGILNGKELTVRFDGPVPSDDRVFVEITKQTENGQLVVKSINNPSSPVNDLLEKARCDPLTHPELTVAAKQILARGGSLSRDILVQLQSFFQNDLGSFAEKLETINMMQEKNVEFTKVQLNAVNAALHGRTLMETLSDLINGPIEKFLTTQKAFLEKSEKVSSVGEGKNDIKQFAPNVDVKQNEVIQPPILGSTAVFNPKKIGQLGFDFRTQDSASMVINNEPAKLLTEPSTANLNQYVTNDAVQSLKLDSTNILVTEKLGQLAFDFDKAAKEISRNLDTASRMIDTKSGPPVKQILNATINHLDKIILKGNYMLYADMSTEKELLAASSKLAEARTFVTKGDYPKANQIIKEIQDVFKNVTFKPSESTVKHFVSEQEILTSKPELERPFLEKDPGARQIFETIKTLGLIHETDAARALTNKQELPSNLKSTLMKMLETGDDPSKVSQALANITGQQLLNKPETTGVQNLFFQLPLLLNNQVENVKVHVKSQKDGKKIDWENCTIYFVLVTQKLGEIGISITSINRTLSITFRNNQDTFNREVQPFTDETKDRLQEIGYTIGTIQFKPFSENVEKKKTQPDILPEFTEKGFDFSI